MINVKPLYIIILLLLTSCTITFEQVMTQGRAEDVIDNIPSTSVDTTVTIPMKM